MITYMYICNACRGRAARRVFEREYADMAAAVAAPLPECPRCGGAAAVERWFGHSFYGPASKSAQRDHDAPTEPLVDFDKASGRGILSVGMRADSEIARKVHENIKRIAREHGADIVERAQQLHEDSETPSAEAPAASESGADNAPEPAAEKPAPDPAEEILGLKPGTPERALFDIRQKKLIKELKSGVPVSGFFMPLNGEESNN